LGLTQEELAKMMGYKSKSTINKIELGVNDIPQSKIVQFAKALGTTPADLMGWKEDDKGDSPDKQPLTEGEQMWLELYHRLSDETRNVLIETIDSFGRLPKDTQKIALQMLRAALGGHK
jgi:transcriptional regulator with XRE-family HTH domain